MSTRLTIELTPVQYESFSFFARINGFSECLQSFYCNFQNEKYSLIPVLHYCRETGDRVTMEHLYIRSLLPHKDYDNTENWEKGVPT